MVNELEALDPVANAVHSPAANRGVSTSPPFQKITIVQFAKKLDSVVDSLNRTADALAATADREADDAAAKNIDQGFHLKTTIH